MSGEPRGKSGERKLEELPAHVVVEAFDHTADVGIGLGAPDLEALFRGAAHGLLRLMFADPAGALDRGRRRERIELRAANLEGLLVAWLDELVFLVQTRGLVPVETSLRVDDVAGSWSLSAELVVAPLLPDPPGWLGEIKATTYHGLQVGLVDGEWRARVIFDV